MWTAAFWRATLERALSTFAQAFLAVLAADGLDVLAVDWLVSVQIAAMAGLLAVLKAVAATHFGAPGPSLGGEILAAEHDEAKGQIGNIRPLNGGR